MKQRLRIRLHHKIYEALELEAVWQDSRIGTLANRIMQEEFARLQAVAPDCILCGADEGDAESSVPLLPTRNNIMCSPRWTAAKSICPATAVDWTQRGRSHC